MFGYADVPQANILNIWQAIADSDEPPPEPRAPLDVEEVFVDSEDDEGEELELPGEAVAPNDGAVPAEPLLVVKEELKDGDDVIGVFEVP